MRTVAQKRKRAAMIRMASIAVLGAIIFTPKLDNIELPEMGLPLVTTAIAGEAN